MSLLRIPAFRLLLAGFFFTALAQWAQRTAVLIWAYGLTGSGVTVSLVGLMEALPFLLLAPLAGVFVDRWDRARTLTVSTIVQAVALLPLLLVHNAHDLWLILVVTLGINAVAQFSLPAATAAVPVVVGVERVGAANALIQMLNSVVLIAAPGLAALLFALLGPHRLVLLLALVYLAAAPLLGRVPAPRPEHVAEGTGTVGRELRAGLRYIRRSRIIMAVLAMAFVALLGAGALSVLDVVFVTRALHLRPENVGILFTASGVGQLLGGLAMVAAGRWASSRYHRVLAYTSLMLGVAIAAYGAAPTLLTAVAALLLGGLMLGPLMVSLTSLVQLSSDDAHMGRVMSLLNAGITIATVISLAGSGALADAVGVRQVITVAGLLVGLSGVLTLVLIRSTPRPVERQRRHDPLDISITPLAQTTAATDRRAS